ncbi:bifunctional UDP-N-acetylglucosamine diphosphorylase/glucosamine-1-phosphate N-acetyltransferase GlmU [Allofustis seminis]|uniref:bifunctional UDP-N-acetylglucosamine diphosphorylase/glucosamine-1-phosphate N-acetyltransferase GlmU n=1 Tax=Allofustis seminis TaxID=166939 RepID=UPI0003732B93|nr:bifunctional UDP-N-acetylglucosamine diphosphorylase/glucosamine-1-phosphate N-acetyltransferase GlmU [Allofustis seminis]
MKRFAIVLAAGQGTRMKSKLYKVMHPVLGKPMVDYVVDAARDAGMDEVITVTGMGAELVEEHLGAKCQFVFQREQLGTAHATQQAESIIGDLEGTTVVLAGDTPLIQADTLKKLIQYHENNQAKATILTAIAPDPTNYGRIVRAADNSVLKIVEEKDASSAEKQIKEINTGTYCFDNRLLFEKLQQVGNDNAQGEYYLPDVIEILQSEDELIAAYTLKDFDEALGVNNRVALSQANQLMRDRINKAHMENGVSFVDPANAYVEATVEIGPDTTIEPGVSLKGDTKIGANVFIGAGTEIIDSQIEDDAEIKQSVIEKSTVGPKVTVGPFAHLRPQSHLLEGAHVGNFVEIKNATLGKFSKAGHHSYVGDAEVGEHVNIGSGVIFCNYDGVNKHRSHIGDYTFIGSNSNIVAPVNVEAEAYIAAGSTIYQDVPSKALAIARARQVNKEGYATKLPNLNHD